MLVLLLGTMIAVTGAIGQFIGSICISFTFAHKLWQGMPTHHFYLDSTNLSYAFWNFDFFLNIFYLHLIASRMQNLWTDWSSVHEII